MDVGAILLPDIYEMPRKILDLTLSYRLGQRFKATFAASNLLDEEETRKQADYIIERRKPGRSYSLKIGIGS
jgi:hypothetical protein